MGSRGPLPKRADPSEPDNVRKLHATTSRQPLPTPPAVKGIAQPADWVPEEGKARWAAVAPELNRLQLLAVNLHADFATVYADTYAKWANAARLVNEAGLLAAGQKGEDRKHPALQVYRDMSSQLIALQAQAAMTPNSLARTPAVESNDGAVASVLS